MPFLMAGDPDLETTAKILLELQANGADMIEHVSQLCGKGLLGRAVCCNTAHKIFQ